MSGPKVVRIVTRDEIVAICRGHLASLDAAIEEWRLSAERAGELTHDDIVAADARREKLRRLLANDRFLDLQKAVPAEIESLRLDAGRRQARAAAERVAARVAQRRTAEAARTLLHRLESTASGAPADVIAGLREAASGRGNGGPALGRAFRLLHASPDRGVTERQRALARALKEDDAEPSLAEWLSTQSAWEEDADLARFDLRLAELAAVLGEWATAGFEARIAAVRDEGVDTNRRALLLDSLEVDLAHAVTHARDRRALEGRARSIAAELSVSGAEVTGDMARRVLAAIEGPDDLLKRLEREGTELLATVRDAEVASSRRQAILQGLAELGYQVTEGMETAWTRDGRVVLKRPAQSGYGVEVTSKVDAKRLQVRTVAFRDPAAPADRSRDEDAETLFCGDVAALQSRIADHGGEIVLERALPVGAAPVKAVADASASLDQDRDTVAGPRARQRTRPE